jgi:uncharacterized membrane protein
MPTPDQERMDAISDALARLVRKQNQTDERLARIEAALNVPPVERAEERRETAPPPPQPIPEPRPIDPPPPHAAPPRRLETQVGLTWVNRIGVITLVIGIGFFFKWAVDNEWIGPAARVGLGVLAGFAALAIADYLWRKGQRTFAQGITGAGIAILYLSIYSAFAFYQLVPQAVAFLAMVLATVLACALAMRYNAAAISALGLFGGYITPILLSTGEDHPWFLFAYVLVLNGGSLALVRSRQWRILDVLSVAATIIIFWSWFSSHLQPEKRLPATAFILLSYALFAEASLLPLFVIAEVSSLFAIGAIWPQSPGVFFFLELVICVGALIVADRRRSAVTLAMTFAAFWTVYGFWYADLHTPVPAGPLYIGLSCAFLLFFGWNVWWFLIKLEAPRVQDMVVLALDGIAYFGAAYHLLNPGYQVWMGLLAVAVASAHLTLGAELWKRHGADTRPILLSLGIAVAFLTLAIPIQFHAYRITMAWSLEAAALTWIAARLRSRPLLYGSLLIVAMLAIRLGAIDSWMYPDPNSYSAVANARFLTFCIAALSAWLSAWWAGDKVVALVDYAAGHFFMLWGMSLEVIGWVERTTPSQNQLSVKTVSISILFALYAVILVSVGVGTRTAVNRIAGLGLIGFVVLKLYVFDVWQLGRIYRISAFVALGALLLATSFLYSHFRNLIESWWREDEVSS